MVKLILYVHRDAGDPGARFINEIQQQFDDVTVVICDGIQCLEKNFDMSKHAGLGRRIFVLFVDNDDRLAQLYDRVELFTGERVVALLPENTKKYLTRINKFYPKYTSLINEPYTDVSSVLKKMITQ